MRKHGYFRKNKDNIEITRDLANIHGYINTISTRMLKHTLHLEQEHLEKMKRHNLDRPRVLAVLRTKGVMNMKNSHIKKVQN